MATRTIGAVNFGRQEQGQLGPDGARDRRCMRLQLPTANFPVLNHGEQSDDSQFPPGRTPPADHVSQK